MPANGRTHVTLHGFGEFAVVYKHLIDAAREQGSNLDFSIVLPTSHHVALLSTMLPADRIFCLETEIARYDSRPVDLAELAGYHGSLHRDIDAEKRTMKHRPAAEQLRQAMATYRAYGDALRRWKPDHVLFAHVESFEQKMMTSLAQELGIPISVPIDCRTFGGSIMCTDVYETLPEVPYDAAPHRAAAEAFVRRFRETQLPAVVNPFPVETRGERLSRHVRPLDVRAKDFVRRTAADPGRFEWDHLKAAVLNNLPRLRDALFNANIRRAIRWHDMDGLQNLPAKFIYYPLQYTPESSINTPAPYYVDQLRVVDAIRHAMPSDHLLIVKDHPAVLRERKRGLIDAIRKKSGVVVMKATVPGRALIERAALTISVTGTSTLEAFLLGKPALTLGGMFMSRFMGGIATVGTMGERIRGALAAPPSDAEVVEAAAAIMALKRPFSIFPLALPDDPVYNKTNIVNMLAALEEAVRLRPKIAT